MIIHAGRAPGRLWIALLCVGVGLGIAAQDDELPEGRGKETLENTCTECHGLDKILGKFRTKPRWRKIATDMRANGATMSDSELETLIEYLYANFGTDEPEAKAAEPAAAKVTVNQASAKDLETGLQLTAGEAAAIVRHREANGPFKQWQDLTKVDGVDKAKIEAKKDQLTF